MPKSEGKKFFFQGQKAIQTDYLEILPYKGKKQHIHIETRELTAVCPFSGLPDFARIIIEYIPHKHILELKSFKYYIVSFRQVGIYQEDLTSRVYADLKKILQPQWIQVTTSYATRGGIDVMCTIDSKIAR